MSLPNPRIDPIEYREAVEERLAKTNRLFRTGSMTIAVYQATLYGLGMRGQAIETETNLNWPKTQVG